MRIPKHFGLKKVPLNAKGLEIQQNRSLCVACNYLVKENLMYDIALHTVVSYFENGKELPSQGDSGRTTKKEIANSDLVPRIIKRINRLITNAKYQEMKTDPGWDHLQIKVCQDCFLHFTQSYAMPKKKILPVKNSETRTWTPPPESFQVRDRLASKSEISINPRLPPIPAKVYSKPKLKIRENLSSKNFITNKPKTRQEQISSEKVEIASNKNILPIYSKKYFTPSKQKSRDKSLKESKSIIKTINDSEFIQDTLIALKKSIKRLSS